MNTEKRISVRELSNTSLLPFSEAADFPGDAPYHLMNKGKRLVFAKRHKMNQAEGTERIGLGFELPKAVVKCLKIREKIGSP